MKFILRVLMLMTLSVTLFAPWVHAEQVLGKRIALVIGNDAYQHVAKLEKAGNDASAMARELKAAGFQVLLHHDLNYRGMVKAVETLSATITGGDQVVVFFAGHGVQIKTGSYLLPVDIEATSESEIEKTAYGLNDLTEKLSETKAAFTLVMVDACRDNPIKANGRSVGATRGLSAIEPPKGQMVVYSASKGQQALDKLNNKDANENGVFTREFIAKMRQPGVRIEDLVREVQDSVESLARSASHEQRPAIYNEARGNFYFYGPTTIQTASTGSDFPGVNLIKHEDKFWSDAKRAGNKEGYEAYLESFPKGRYASLAKANLTRLGVKATSSAPAVQVPNVPRSQPVELDSLPTGKIIKDCHECPELVVIPAGSFNMGSSSAEQAMANASGSAISVTSRESPLHQVNVGSFAAGRYAVTKGEFANFVNAKGYRTEAERGDGCSVRIGNEWKEAKAYNWRNVGFSQGDDHPVVCVTWNDAKAYAQWLSQISGKQYRLLSESEREYVTRAGTQTAFWWGNSINVNVANYNGSASSYGGSPKGEFRKTTMPVNSFSPNPFGLYNVHGNVWEWVEDCWHDNYSGAPSDGSAWVTGCNGNFRVIRGGSWGNVPTYLRAADRNKSLPDGNVNGGYGFRLARALDP